MIFYEGQIFQSEKDLCKKFELNLYFFTLYRKDLKLTVQETADYLRARQKRKVRNPLKKE